MLTLRQRVITYPIVALALVSAGACRQTSGQARAVPTGSALTAASSASATTHSAQASPGPAVATKYADWPTYHGDGARSGRSAAPAVTRALVKHWAVGLDGAVYGSPIVVAGGIGIVVTENNSMYRIANNRVIWKRNFGPPVAGSALPCGNIDPSGITSTPAYDPTTKTVVAVALRGNPIRHIAYGVDPVSGRQIWSRNVDVPTSEPGISPQAMQQRGALLVTNRQVFITYGGLAGDCSSYRGSLVALNLDHPTTAALRHYTIPTSREAGIWAPPGAIVDPDGGVLVAAGNGATAGTGAYDYSDSVLRISVGRRLDSFSPSTWRTDNRDDLDLGSQGPALVGKWVFIAGKSGVAYVLDRAHLGGIGGQKASMQLCRSFGGTAVSGNVVYVPCTDGLRAVRINADGTMTVLWHAASSITGSPVIGGGRIFSLDTGAGVLHLLDPATGTDRGAYAVGPVNRFATPALYGRLVIVGWRNGVAAYMW
ncbi:PQQ-like beta-propeller repeat protein [Jatrophihabitans telluris]|uniref:PQQ-like beta-propeller repeat protein n=1 Tax=Jatrophihabitans telluris TaxID=2038343 RepID=A0ABY4R2M6_9ACTN|nr:PQQ-like beta-propeller repeat protein [Jatrophihabitans telluris]UQX89980.1 PQQ-like beta-propeller repeat protein [Jatrophihabitans telluris]